MRVWIGLLGWIIALAVSAIYIVHLRNIKRVTGDLKENADKDLNKELRLYAPDGSLEKLIIQLNRILSIKEKERIEYDSKEAELRRQIANISHDLRTPLTSILGYIELIQDESTTDEEKTQYLDIVQRRSQVLQTLITSFYDLSRIDAGEYPMELENVNISYVLKEVAAAFYYDFEGKNFPMKVDLDEEIPAIISNKNVVTRIFTNIIQNALKHGYGVMDIKLYKAEDGIHASFSNGVKDFKAEDLDHVFDRFFTSDRMRTGQNTGLGLTIVKKLAESMGYEVKAYYNGEVFSIEVIFKG